MNQFFVLLVASLNLLYGYVLSTMCPGRGAQNTHTGWMRDAAVKELIHRCFVDLQFEVPTEAQRHKVMQK